MTLKQETVNWTGRLAQKAQLGDDAPRVSVRRAEFISVHGGGGSENQVDPLTGKEIDMGLTLCYVLPTTTRGVYNTSLYSLKLHSLHNIHKVAVTNHLNLTSVAFK